MQPHRVSSIPLTPTKDGSPLGGAAVLIFSLFRSAENPKACFLLPASPDVDKTEIISDPRFPLKFLLLILMLVSFPSMSATPLPFEALDTSSPRSLLEGYLRITSEIYQEGTQTMGAYRDSGRLYMTAEERHRIESIRRIAMKLANGIDLSTLPPVTRDEAQRRIMIQLKEVLDRVELPPMQEVPDAKAMQQNGKTRWVIPKTDIAIQQIEAGPRKGEYIFSADTIDRISEIYELAKSLPYVHHDTEYWYDHQMLYPVAPMFALGKVIPPRWILNQTTMDASQITWLNQPLWRWFGVFLLVGIVAVISRRMFRLSARLQSERPDTLGLLSLLRPFTVIALSAFSARMLAEVLRVSDVVFISMVPTVWGIFFIALSWLFWNLGDVLAEVIIASERMIKGSINSQLTRFLMRLISFCLVIATLVVGGQSLGLPAYSIMASIGVGGLAVALAAQHTLANLLASLIIMFEKPFVIGSRVKVTGQGGTVSSVGFRSTQILTDTGATISIPNDKVISGPIEADNTRPQNHVSATLSVPSRSSVVVIRNFLALARDHLKAADMVETPSVSVGVSGLQGDKVEILIEFILTGPFGERVAERKNHILLELLEIGHQSGIVGNGEAIAHKS